MGQNHATALCVANAGIHNAATTTKLVPTTSVGKSFQCAAKCDKKFLKLLVTYNFGIFPKDMIVFISLECFIF